MKSSKKSKFNQFFVLVVVLGIQFKLNAQEPYPNVIHPDPVSAEFQKYLGYPVSHSTGIPQINIPLYTMNASGVSIPFSLSYHASGIKVEQEMGHIGLGWSLFPGFKITRSIRGKPDDRYPTNDIRDLDADFSAYNIARQDASGNPIVPSPYFEYLYNITPHDSQSVMFGNNISGTTMADTQHDIFTLHLPQNNITFIVEWINGSPQTTTIPESSIKIDLVGLDVDGKFDSFEVTDENGMVYTFGNSGEFGYFESNDSHEGATTGWLLKTIDPPGTNNSLTFTYNTAFNKVQQTLNNTTIGFVDEIFGDTPYGTNSDYPPPVETTDFNYPDSYNVATIDEITYETGETVDFSYSTITGYMYDALDNITFKNKNGTVVKTVDFERLDKQLTKLTVSGEGAYEFVYDTQDVSPPAGKYTGSDFLGLFNGEYGDVSAVPEMYLYANTHGVTPTELPYLIGDVDIKSHPIKSQARILKNIIYPTGGQTSFEYEPNFYRTLNEGLVSGLGLRIKEIDTYDPISGKTLTKSYRYGQNEDGIGNCTIPSLDITTGQGATQFSGPYIDAYVSQRQVGFLLGSYYRIRTVSSNANTGVVSDPIIWYNQVTEYSNEGKTVFDFEFTPTEYYPYADGGIESYGSQITYEATVPRKFFPTVLRNVGNSSPRLVRQEIKDANNNTLQLVENNYSNDRRNVLGIYARINSFFARGLAETGPFSPQNPNAIIFWGILEDYLIADEYDLIIDNDKLISTVQTDYRDGIPVVSQTDYEYDDTYKFNLKSKTVTASNGDALTEKYYYPVGDAIPDFNNLTTDQQTMVNTFASSKNYQGRVIEKEVYKNSILLSTELYGYKDWGNTLYKTENVYTKKGNSGFRTLYTIEECDVKGNILDIIKEDGVHTSYIWGYDKQYPITKIENASYGTIATALGITMETLKSSYDETDLAVINGLRTNASMQNSMVTTYTYKPLVGITTVTDPKDYAVNYFYDADNRLETVRDNENKLINDYEYNFVPFGTYDPIAVPVYAGNFNSGGGETLLDKVSYTISPITYDFGTKAIGASNTFAFTITNTTPSVYTTNYFTLDSIDLPDGFVLVSKPSQVSRGTPGTIIIAFEPTAITSYTGNAVLYVNGSSSMGSQIQLSGEGITNNSSGVLEIKHNGAIVGSLDFGTVSSSDFVYEDVEIHNSGTNPLTVTNITSSNPTGFLVAPSLPITLQPGASYFFTVDFIAGSYASSMGQQVNEYITIQSSDMISNNVLQLTGYVTN